MIGTKGFLDQRDVITPKKSGQVVKGLVVGSIFTPPSQCIVVKMMLLVIMANI